ncbi:hypothetical protein AN958_04293 [Leucoagaricus sp. SymC.cos]|nr:hypothetical protein AN958_04293 [Leucoagaricus sp. SymC.cos]
MSSHSFIDSLKYWFKRRSRARMRQNPKSSQSSPESEGNEAHRRPGLSSGPFANAQNFTINNAVMAENMFLQGNTVFQHLASYTTPEAAVDSSARYPPPTCHPRTRLTIRTKLTNWLDDPARQWDLIWLHGSAGCGKSAVAQSFAEVCAETGRLGAAFFFSRPNKRNNPNTVIPTLAYQLAYHCPAYKILLTSVLANDEQLLTKARPVQFKKLIVDPWSQLQSTIQQPFLILLDGLDECEGPESQRDFIRLIYDVVRVKKDLPLLWLICSRPEFHLQTMFARIPECGREELEIDAECISDVDRYLRDKFFELQTEYAHLTGSEWPSETQFKAVSEGGGGHFIFASVAMAFVGDAEYANPIKRLETLIAFLEQAEGDSTLTANPLAKLDFLYTCIFQDIPEDILPTAWRIIAYIIHNGRGQLGAQMLCNYLGIDQSTFYGALQKLHSIIDIPTPEKADTPLHFYHASLSDFLVDRRRSGRFAVETKTALIDIAKTALFWHERDSNLFHTDYTSVGDSVKRSHEHAAFPGLKWTSNGNDEKVTRLIADFAQDNVWATCEMSCKPDVDHDVVASFFKIDHQHLVFDFYWVNFDPSSNFIRTEPSNETDAQLLKHLALMTEPQVARPAPFPLQWNEYSLREREYVLIGYGEKSAAVLYTGMFDEYRFDNVNHAEPSQEQISEYQKWLQIRGWYNGDKKSDEQTAAEILRKEE